MLLFILEGNGVKTVISLPHYFKNSKYSQVSLIYSDTLLSISELFKWGMQGGEKSETGINYLE